MHELNAIVICNGTSTDICRIVGRPVINDHNFYISIRLAHKRAKTSRGAFTNVIHGDDDTYLWGFTVFHWEATPLRQIV